ncbi:hypothetical protein LCM17_16155 [Cereibacter sphaeroides]|nr:hypothetical protein [Cereibacter sphaeroides]
MSVSPRLMTAAALLALTGVVHVALGGTAVYEPLLAVSPTTELTLYLALLWHFVTVYFAFGALGTGWAALAPTARRQTAAVIAILGLGMGALFLAFGLTMLGEPWTAPQWIITLVIAGLALWPPRSPSNSCAQA